MHALIECLISYIDSICGIFCVYLLCRLIQKLKREGQPIDT